MLDQPMSAVLPTTHARVISALITGLYVGGLYVSRSARLSFSKASQEVGENGERTRRANEKWRDDEEVIKARLKAAVMSTFISCGIVYACVSNGSRSVEPWKASVEPSLRLLGLQLPSLNFKFIVSHLLTPILYTGPLTARFLSGTLPLQRNWSYLENLRPLFTTLIGLRNYILAPITEEIVFRSCLLAIAGMSGRGTYHKLFITPLWFGCAHLHHTYELYNRFGRTRTALVRAVLNSLVQLAYTTLFGAYSAFLLLRTGSILAPITAHFTANLLGIPYFRYELRQHPTHKLLLCTAYLVGISSFFYILSAGDILL